LVFALGSCGSDSEPQDKPAVNATVQEAALEKYRWYLERNASELVDWTSQMWGQIVAGEVSKAHSRYATSRVQWGQIGPAAELVPGLASRINGGDEVKDAEGPPLGFHEIETTLFGLDTTNELKPVAKRLVKDNQRLHYEVKTMELKPVPLVEATQKRLEKVSRRMVTGEEAPLVENDFADVSANVEGAEAIFEAVRPTLMSRDPTLVESFELAFFRAYDALGEVGGPAREPASREPAAGVGFIGYSEISKAEVGKIEKAIESLQRVVSKTLRVLEEEA
jgi:iron uptake system component EfeO